jgi:hypothetical protein
MTKIAVHQFPDLNGNKAYQVFLNGAPVTKQYDDEIVAYEFARAYFHQVRQEIKFMVWDYWTDKETVIDYKKAG